LIYYKLLILIYYVLQIAAGQVSGRHKERGVQAAGRWHRFGHPVGVLGRDHAPSHKGLLYASSVSQSHTSHPSGDSLIIDPRNWSAE